MNPKKIVLTGGPGGGKTTAADLISRDFNDHIVIVPEAATILYSGGFPRRSDDFSRKAAQTSIYNVQKNLEEVQSIQSPDKILFCDRGALDCAVYWPDGPDDFFEWVGTTLEAELNAFEAVVFFESAAVGGSKIDSGNPIRNENLEQAKILDKKLRDIYSKHNNFYLIEHHEVFFEKMKTAYDCLQQILKDLSR
ncbi:MAG: AAA family ATPase [Bdellovibrionales bacterium]